MAESKGKRRFPPPPPLRRAAGGAVAAAAPLPPVRAPAAMAWKTQPRCSRRPLCLQRRGAAARGRRAASVVLAGRRLSPTAPPLSVCSTAAPRRVGREMHCKGTRAVKRGGRKTHTKNQHKSHLLCQHLNAFVLLRLPYHHAHVAAMVAAAHHSLRVRGPVRGRRRGT